ncbi:Uma2 family endonuclease [Methylobacterium sp. R2-1]|uniref:Uma2 family endonuclease n=1 Tax=Methylobacterium sp. R2-1 TaxID=2587064 RepID=UPI0016140E48|nr:Uma2 family endonuclease [Methylobacterium sp. R2-1]MBB2962313.1 Uma2 family endonuclease [Methylobacterium sp. R2-1]
MALAFRRDPGMRVAEYQAWVADRPDEERWELIDGEPVLLAPQSERHQQIVLNLSRKLSDIVRDRGCRAIPGIAVLSDAMDTFAPIPDVAVRCGPMLKDGYARDSVLVAEVLSPLTMSRDRGRKTDFYRNIVSLKAFLIVYQDEPRVEVWRRAPDGGWAFEARGLDGAIELPELGGRLAVAEIYDDIAF